MTVEVRLTTSQEKFEALHQVINTRKDRVHVDREALDNLLMDHSTMFKALKGSTSFRILEPSSQRLRERIKL